LALQIEINVHRGWLRVWTVGTILWVLAAGAFAWSNWPAREGWEQELVACTGKADSCVSAWEAAEDARYNSAMLTLLLAIAGPPIAVPTGVGITRKASRWVADGFKQPR
jgi:hypothetical protein